MRRITKGGAEPKIFASCKRSYGVGGYRQITRDERHAMRCACIPEQYFLCAYCCQSITGEPTDTVVEHVEAQSAAPHRSLDYSNIVLSCRAPNQCDAAHRSKPLPLTPLMKECETELRFKLSGRVEGLTPRAKKSIAVLNLGDTPANNRGLVEKRKQLSINLLWEMAGADPSDIREDDELIKMLIADLNTPQNGKLQSYAPALANTLSHWLAP